MPFDKDTAKKAGQLSTRKGKPNKATNEARKCFQLLVDNNAPRLQQWMDEVAKDNPAKALDFFIRMAEFVIPKLQRAEIVDKRKKEPITIIFTDAE